MIPTLLFAVLLGQPAALPDWVSELNPSANFRLRWTERYEDIHDQSGLSLLAKGGVFPVFIPQVRAGLEISTGGTAIGNSPSFVEFSEGMSPKAIGISQAYAAFQLGSLPFEWTATLGKFASPLLFSPLLWDDSINPEGLLQSLNWTSPSGDLQIAAYAGQFSVDQVSISVVNGTPLRRSWLFQNGVVSSFRAPIGAEFKGAINHYFFYDLSERVAEASSKFGNSITGTPGANPQFSYSYAPVEFVAEILANPLGIQTSLRGAFAINFRTPDKQRSFWVQTSLGNPWKKGNFVGHLSYYYNEPDVTVALLTENEYGSANRKGPRLELSYFILDQLRTSGSFLYAETLAKSQQANRTEFFFELELLF